MSSDLPCVCSATELNQIKRLPIEAGSPRRCPCLLSWRGYLKWNELEKLLSWGGKGDPRARREMDCSQSQIWLLITGEPGLCVSGHADVQLAGAVILGVDISHMNCEGQGSAEVRRSLAHQRRSSETRLPHAKWETVSANMWYEYIWSADNIHICFSQYSHFRGGRAWVFICMRWSEGKRGNRGSIVCRFRMMSPFFWI